MSWVFSLWAVNRKDLLYLAAWMHSFGFVQFAKNTKYPLGLTHEPTGAAFICKTTCWLSLRLNRLNHPGRKKNAKIWNTANKQTREKELLRKTSAGKKNTHNRNPGRLASLPFLFVHQSTSPWLPGIKQHNSRANEEGLLCRVTPGAAWKR